jgi:hypothetical protein
MRSEYDAVFYRDCRGIFLSGLNIIIDQIQLEIMAGKHRRIRLLYQYTHDPIDVTEYVVSRCSQICKFENRIRELYDIFSFINEELKDVEELDMIRYEYGDEHDRCSIMMKYGRCAPDLEEERTFPKVVISDKLVGPKRCRWYNAEKIIADALKKEIGNTEYQEIASILLGREEFKGIANEFLSAPVGSIRAESGIGTTLGLESKVEISVKMNPEERDGKTGEGSSAEDRKISN